MKLRHAAAFALVGWLVSDRAPLSNQGIFAVLMMIVVGAALARWVDARYWMAGGLITMSLGNYWMALQNLDFGPWQVVWPRVVVIAGLSMLMGAVDTQFQNWNCKFEFTSLRHTVCSASV